MEPSFGSFNTGLPSQPQSAYQPPVSSYPSNMMTPAPVSSYQQPPMMVPSYQTQPPVSSYQPTPSQPPVAQIPAQEPPQGPPPAVDSASLAAGSNPLLRRGRAVDPSLTTPAGGYGGGGQFGGGYMQPQPPVSDSYGGYSGARMMQPSEVQAPVSAPSIFTPDSPGAAMTAPAPSQFTSTPGHVPDQPGPGNTHF